MHDIFISYSTKDQFQADTLRDILEKNGIVCWMAPRDIPGGSNYTKEIPSAIRGCQVFVLILSQHSQNSQWVLRELDSAVNCGKVILPFMLEEFQLNDEFNFLLTGAQRYAAYQKKVDALEALISRIRAIISNTETPAPESTPIQEPAPAPEPEVPASQTFFGITQCPSCGNNELIEMKKIRKVTALEKLWWLLVPVGGVVIGFATSVLTLPLSMLSFPTETTVAIYGFLSLAGIVGGCFLGNRMANEQIRRQRVRKHLHPYPMRCTACNKLFLIEEL